MAQYPIPQFIEAEGKIISFLTFRQFFWIVGGGAACMLFYYTLPFFLFVVLSVITALFVALVAFVKIDNVSVLTIFFNFLTFSTKTKDYTWKKKEMPYPFKAKPLGTAIPAANQSKLKDTIKIVEYRKK